MSRLKVSFIVVGILSLIASSFIFRDWFSQHTTLVSTITYGVWIAAIGINSLMMSNSIDGLTQDVEFSKLRMNKE